MLKSRNFLCLLLVLASSLLVRSAPAEECCQSKEVGNVKYRFVEKYTSGVPESCLSNCVYEREEGDGRHYCFASGDLEVHCSNGTAPTAFSGLATSSTLPSCSSSRPGIERHRTLRVAPEVVFTRPSNDTWTDSMCCV